MDLRRSLEEIAGPAMPPTADQITSDLARGRKALRRRRTVQAAGGGVLTAAVIAGAMAFASGAAQSTGGTFTAAGPALPSISAAAPSAGTPSTTTAPVRLVPYTGKPGKGFTIETYPKGWFIQGDNHGVLVIAPHKAAPQNTQSRDAGVAASSDSDPYSFVGKITVSLQSKDATDEPEGDKVTVGDQIGVLSPITKDDDAQTLSIKQPNGIYLQVQFWNTIGLTQEQMLEFGAGVHVRDDAVQGVG